MKLANRTLSNLALMICGDKERKVSKNFPYRSSSRLTDFFSDCDLYHVHDGSTRRFWVMSVLEKLNMETTSLPDLPSDALVAVIEGLSDKQYFEDESSNWEKALEALNDVLDRESLVVFPGSAGRCHLRNNGTGACSAQIPNRPRALSPDESAQRDRVSGFLDTATEDEITEVVLVPLFQRLGFHRVEASGHREKTLEYGKDLWMKFQLPTGHWLYFCAQVKKGKIDARGASGGNVTEVLNQVRMAMSHAVFDPDISKKVLLDHIYIISGSVITRAARNWIAEHLDKEQRRQIIFMDREEFLNHAARIVSDLPLPIPPKEPADEMPF